MVKSLVAGFLVLATCAVKVHAQDAAVVIARGKSRGHLPDGTTSHVTYTPGQTMYREPVTHWAENIGKTTIRLVVVEFKSVSGQ